MPPPDRGGRRIPRFLLALALASLGLFAFQNQSLLDGIHEVRVLETAREMLEFGDWIVPRFAGAVRLEKPPLPYWIAAFAYQLAGGPSVAAARHAAALHGLVMLLAVWAIARAAGTPREARYAMALLAGFLLFNAEFRKVTTDPFLAAWSTAAVAGFAWAWRLPGIRATACLLFACLSLALALLAKGPIALAFVGLGAFFVRPPRMAGPGWAVHLLGLLLACLPLLAWALLVRERLPDAFDLWRFEVLGRVTGEVGESRSRWFYFAALLPAAAPLLPPFGAGLLRGLKSRDPFALWFAAGLVFLLFLSSRKAAYLLPLLAPAALLGARYLSRLPHYPEGLWLARAQLAINLLSIAALLGAALAWRNQLSWGAAPMVLLLILAAAMLLRQAWRGRIRTGGLLASGALIVLFYGSVLLPHLPEDRTLYNLGAYLNEHVPKRAPLYQQGGADPRLAFYIDRLPSALDEARLCAVTESAWLIRQGPLPGAADCGWEAVLATPDRKGRDIHLYRRSPP